jgi:hypothetical protein
MELASASHNVAAAYRLGRARFSSSKEMPRSTGGACELAPLGRPIVPLNGYTPLIAASFVLALFAEVSVLACGFLHCGAAEHGKVLICLVRTRLKERFTIHNLS